MSATSPIRLVFLWHFHQPWYLDLDGSPARLPWVRLHALKDYADLPRLLSSNPAVPHAANLVPGLIDQIDLLSSGCSDVYLEIARTPVSQWDERTIDFVLQNFFSAHPVRMIAPLTHYAALQARYRRAVKDGAAAARREFSAEDLRDLVVFFHLAWSGETLSKDPLLTKLRRRGHRFSEPEKEALLDRQAAFLSEVIPAWKRAFRSGAIEASVSPYHHPILPLLVDGSSAREAVPHMTMPSLSFRHPEDARAQVGLGLDTFERHFGFRPAGMWPPEGSISEGALKVMGGAGVKWVASDQDVLLNSLAVKDPSFGPGDRARIIFRPYRLAGTDSPVLFFRDRALSDRIGFSYATWPAEDAAVDFLSRVLAIREAASNADLVVPVILDGENAWESYPENGAPFLSALTRALSSEPRIRVTTPSRVIEEMPITPLPRLVAGSWIDSSFTTWIGAPSKNRAWEILTRARDALAPEISGVVSGEPTALKSPADILRLGASPEERAHAALLAAEASDWFWWFGEDHTSAHDSVFDALFRGHVAGAYRALGEQPPDELDHPVEISKAPPAVIATTPIAPLITGGPPDYFEWQGAASQSGQPRGTMNRGGGTLKQVFFGGNKDGSLLFLRLDPAVPPASRSLSGHTLRVSVLSSGSNGAEEAPTVVTRDLVLSPGVREIDGCVIGLDRIVELSLPRTAAAPSDPVAFRLTLVGEGGHDLESVPPEGWIHFRTVPADWSA